MFFGMPKHTAALLAACAGHKGAALQDSAAKSNDMLDDMAIPPCMSAAQVRAPQRQNCYHHLDNSILGSRDFWG